MSDHALEFIDIAKVGSQNAGKQAKKVARLPDPQNSCEVFDDFQDFFFQKVTQVV